MSIVESLLALEKIKRPSDQKFLISTSVTSEEKGYTYFIPLYMTMTEKEAQEKVEDIMKLTGYKDLTVSPFGKWMSLGDPTNEKVTILDAAKSEEEKADDLKKEREKITKEIQEEQEMINDPDSIESYYYDWYCAVQNKVSVQNYGDILDTSKKVYEKRISNIRNKEMLHPSYKDTWQSLLLSKLTRRGESEQGKMIIETSNIIRKEESLD